MQSVLHRSVVLALACSFVVAGLSACGDSSGDAAGASATAQEKRDDARLKFTKCLRENGVDVPDNPGAGGGGGGPLRFRAGDRAAFQKAQKTCGKYLRGVVGDISQADRTRFRDAALKFARCMRAKGVDIPDPMGGGGPGGGPGIQMRIPNTPRAQDAMKTCQKLIPRPGGAGGPGPGPGGP